MFVKWCVADPLSLVRDHRAKEVLNAQGITVRSFNADLLYEPWDVNDVHGRPFTTFAAFWDRCLSMPYDPDSPLLPPKRIIPGLLLFIHFLSSYISFNVQSVCSLFITENHLNWIKHFHAQISNNTLSNVLISMIFIGLINWLNLFIRNLKLFEHNTLFGRGKLTLL